jgi:hypothetical protein
VVNPVAMAFVPVPAERAIALASVLINKQTEPTVVSVVSPAVTAKPVSVVSAKSSVPPVRLPVAMAVLI